MCVSLCILYIDLYTTAAGATMIKTHNTGYICRDFCVVHALLLLLPWWWWGVRRRRGWRHFMGPLLFDGPPGTHCILRCSRRHRRRRRRRHCRRLIRYSRRQTRGASRPLHYGNGFFLLFSIRALYTGTPTPHHHAITAAAAAATSLATVFSRARIMFTARIIYHARPRTVPSTKDLYLLLTTITHSIMISTLLLTVEYSV